MCQAQKERDHHKSDLGIKLKRRPQYLFGILSLVSQTPRQGSIQWPHLPLQYLAFRPINGYIVFGFLKRIKLREFHQIGINTSLGTLD